MRSLVKKPRLPPSPFEPWSFDSSAATSLKSSPPLTRAAAFLHVVHAEDVVSPHLLLGASRS